MNHFFRQIGYFRQKPHHRTAWVGLLTLWMASFSLAPSQQVSSTEADAKSLLEKAIRRLPQVEPWAANFRQAWPNAGLLAEAQGTLAVGPARRAHVQIRIRLADSQAELRLYSDGQTIWRQERLPNRSPKLVRYTFEDIEQAIAQANLGESESARLREAVLAEHGYLSLRWRLTELLTRCQWGPPQSSSLPDKRPAWVLEGSWNEKTIREAFRGQLPQAPEIPKRCRVFLLRSDAWWGGDSLWPARIEWWGQPRKEKEDKILAWLEWDVPRRLESDAPELRAPFTSEELAQAEQADVSQLISDTLQRLR